MKLSLLLATLEELAPLRLAEPWDNVGLLAGDPDSNVTKALLTIDMTKVVVEEALQLGCEFIIAYHPPIFEALKRIDGKSSIGLALRHGLAIYSPHTALDSVSGGVNDVLADAVGLLSRSPLRRASSAIAPTAATPLGKDVVGMGRIGPVAAVARAAFVETVKKGLGVSQVLVAGPHEGMVQTVAVAAGAAGDLLREAIRQGADAVVTGEVRHHDALAAAPAGVTVVCARHSCSERQALTPFRQRLAHRHDTLQWFISERDADPFRFA